MMIWNALRVRFAHIQRKNNFNFAILENLRIFQNCLFTGGVVAANGSYKKITERPQTFRYAEM